MRDDLSPELQRIYARIDELYDNPKAVDDGRLERLQREAGRVRERHQANARQIPVRVSRIAAIASPSVRVGTNPPAPAKPVQRQIIAPHIGIPQERIDYLLSLSTIGAVVLRGRRDRP